MPDQYLVLGAGVVGLSTALELKRRKASANVVIAAKHFPGDRSIDYCSPWAGANWMSTATDNGNQEEWDAETYRRFGTLADSVPEAAITRMKLNAFFDNPIEDAGILSKGTGKIWYDEITGGLQAIPHGKLPTGAHFGMVVSTFMVNTQGYLAWLSTECLKAGIQMRRTYFEDVRHAFSEIPSDAYFNCTGLGSYYMKGIEDKSIYPTRGQVMLVETPKQGLDEMYFRSPRRVDKDTTYVFPRHPTGGVVLGGCRVDHDWSDKVDPEFAEDIKRRCCALAPKLGRPEDLKVIYHSVGLRRKMKTPPEYRGPLLTDDWVLASRASGPRVETEMIDGQLVIHNYGHGGTGYQSSW